MVPRARLVPACIWLSMLGQVEDLNTFDQLCMRLQVLKLLKAQATLDMVCLQVWRSHSWLQEKTTTLIVATAGKRSNSPCGLPPCLQPPRAR